MDLGPTIVVGPSVSISPPYLVVVGCQLIVCEAPKLAWDPGTGFEPLNWYKKHLSSLRTLCLCLDIIPTDRALSWSWTITLVLAPSEGPSELVWESLNWFGGSWQLLTVPLVVTPLSCPPPTQDDPLLLPLPAHPYFCISKDVVWAGNRYG